MDFIIRNARLSGRTAEPLDIGIARGRMDRIENGGEIGQRKARAQIP